MRWVCKVFVTYLSESRMTRGTRETWILSFVPQTFSLRFLAQTGKFVLHSLPESRRTRMTRISRMGDWQDKFLFKRFRQTLNRRLGVPNLIIRAIGEIRDSDRREIIRVLRVYPRFRKLTIVTVKPDLRNIPQQHDAILTPTGQGLSIWTKRHIQNPIIVSNKNARGFASFRF